MEQNINKLLLTILNKRGYLTPYDYMLTEIELIDKYSIYLL